MNRIQISEAICKTLVKSRNDAGKTQKYMSLALGKNLNTIQNYESGLTAVSMEVVIEWFEILNLNFMYYFLEAMYPDKYKKETLLSSDDAVKDALIDYISNIASLDEIRKLSFCIFGNSGSSWNAQLDMLTANNHVHIRNRINIAQSILDNYLMAESQDELIHADHISPDIANLKSAIESCRQSVYKGSHSYVIANEKCN